MCGIWASVGLSANPAVIAAIAHRGPDGSGWQEHATAAGPLALGHRRLAIIDTSIAAAQPMASEDGGLVVVYNGEIYNHVELRAELAGLGHRFRTGSDTEVLLAAFAHWGEECLSRFNGMFAFVLWDRHNNLLFAARDRFGVKPLYLWHDTRGVALCSEIKQLTALQGFQARLAPGPAQDFLAWGVFDHTAETLFAGVRQLLGGECATIRLERPVAIAEVRRWYVPPRVGGLVLPADGAQARLRELLDDAVRIRLRSDVPVGACLSGGLDSSSIVCLAAPRVESPLVTVSACYDDPEIDESRHIAVINEAARTRPMIVRPDGSELPQLLDQLVYHQDNPVTSTSVFAQWCVFAAARQAGVPVMLDGQGADEQWCGYHPFFTAHHSALLRRGQLALLWREMAAQRRRHGTPAWWQAKVALRALLPKQARHWTRRLRGSGHPDWLRPVEPSQRPLPATVDPEDLIHSQIYHTSLPMLLHYEDRNSMAHGVESRLPFMDYRLVELALGLGGRHKIVDGETKWLLRRAMEGTLPPAIRHRQDKIGFATPQADWLTRPGRALVAEGLAEAARRFPDLFCADALQRLIRSCAANDSPPHADIWRIVSFAAWGRVFGISG